MFITCFSLISKPQESGFKQGKSKVEQGILPIRSIQCFILSQSFISHRSGNMWFLSVLLLAAALIFSYFRFRFSRHYVLAEKIGGPKGCPILGHVHLFLRKEFLSAMMEMDAMYYGIARFWLGHKLVVGINDPDLYEDLLNNKSALDKGDFYQFMRPLFGEGLIASDSQVWQINRKFVAPTLNALKVKTLISVFTEGSKKLVEDLLLKTGNKFEPYADISKTAFGFTMQTALGKTSAWDDAQLEEMIRLVNRISAGVAYRFIRPWLYPEWLFNLTPTGKQVKSDTRAFRSFLRHMIAMKKESNSVLDGGFISHVLDVSSRHDEFSDGAVLDELSTYMTAGFETTATAITFTLVMLGCHPELQDKVYVEQMELTENDLGWDTICKMEYLEMFIKETMRLFPVITVIGRQLSSDITVAKKIIPRGAFALIPVYAIHRNPTIWENPNTFDPERFLPSAEKNRHHLSYLPFGGGPRICMGQKYAMASMKTMISLIVRHFRIFTDYSMQDIKLSKSVTLNTQGLNIMLESRS